MILNSFSDELGMKPEFITINELGFWNLSSLMAKKFYEKRMVFIGDSAHSFPPSGGFGMNTGILDVHNLAHKIEGILFAENLKESEDLLERYSTERIYDGQNKLNTATEWYYKSLDIAKQLGLNIDN